MIASCTYRLAIDTARRRLLEEGRPCTLFTQGIPGEVVRQDVASGFRKVVEHEFRLRHGFYSAAQKAQTERELRDDLEALSHLALVVIDGAEIDPAIFASASAEEDVLIITDNLRFACDEYLRRKAAGESLDALFDWLNSVSRELEFKKHIVPYLRAFHEVAKDVVSPAGLKYFSEHRSVGNFDWLFDEFLIHAVLEVPDWADRVRALLELPDEGSALNAVKVHLLLAGLLRRHENHEVDHACRVLANGDVEDSHAWGVFHFVRDNPYDRRRWKRQLDYWNERTKIRDMVDADGHNALWFLLFNTSLVLFAFSGEANNPFMSAYRLLQEYGCSELHRDRFGLPMASICEQLKEKVFSSMEGEK